MDEGEFVTGLARVVEWLMSMDAVIAAICALFAGICFYVGINLLANAWTVKPKFGKSKRDINAAIAKEREQLRTTSSTHTLCFGCMFEISGGLECWSCVRRSNLKDNFRARRVGGGVG